MSRETGPDGDGPGGHQHDLGSLRPELANLAHDAAQNSQVDACGVVATAGEYGSAGFYDDAPVQQGPVGVV